MLNLVVHSLSRGAGVGQALMAAASELAVRHWDAERLYVHVDSQNEARDLQEPCTARGRWASALQMAVYAARPRSEALTLPCGLQGACNLYNRCGFSVWNDFEPVPALGARA